MTTAPLDPRTPVLVGVGQSSERIDDPDYTGLSAVDLAAAAAREALADTGADPDAVATAIDTVAAVRQFEVSTPISSAPLGRSDNVPRSVAARLGADPRRAVLEVGGGQSPQHLVTELAGEIAAGASEVVLLVGGEAMSTVRHLAGTADRPDFTEHVEGTLEDRGFGLQGLISRYEVDHGLAGATPVYALLEHARRARLGLSRDEHAAEMGALFAPFTSVAAAHPHAAAPVRRDAAELVTPTAANRMIADPYPRYVVARDQVNQGAAVVMMSVAAADRLGVPEDRRVFLHGHADLRERPLLERPDLGSAPASVRAARHALDLAGIGIADVATFDFYSCYPVAVLATAVDGLGLSPGDPRGLTLTGGLPFFGGAGNDYAMHAIAETVQAVRRAPGSFGFVGANGGMLSKYSAGVYSTAPVPWRDDDSAVLQAELDAAPTVPVTLHPSGWARIETFTLTHERDGRRTGIVVGRLEDDDTRFLATTVRDDDEMLALLAGPEPIGERVFVCATPRGNRVVLSDVRARELFPPRAPGFRDAYEHVLVRREGHLLEVTINRPEQRNALTPPANDELDEVFDAFFADPDLWVAILTGAGEKAFSAGNDLLWTVSGKQTWVPDNGFAGLTGRRALPKPVIAAVNGYAMGGGLEIALACQLVVADETATFALSEVQVGLIAGAGGLVRLPRTVPPRLAHEMILTGRRLDAAEALEHGLVNRVVPAGTALEGARALADRILAVSPTSVRASLQVMAETAGVADTVEAVRQHSSAMDDLLISADTVEGLTAFAEKRPPRWTGR
ncbi:MAG: acetyl-CoA acetyltransferase [Marmoricola sp.]